MAVFPQRTLDPVVFVVFSAALDLLSYVFATILGTVCFRKTGENGCTLL